MTLTPATVRFDKKCGASYIPDNKRCRQGALGAGLGRVRDANRRWEQRYGKPKKQSNKDRIKAAGVAALAAGAGVGIGIVSNKMRNKRTQKPVSINFANIRVPKPGAIKKPGSVETLKQAADRGRLNELESFARGNNPALEAQMQVSKARNNKTRKELEGMKSEFQRLRTEIGVWGPNRIKPFKRPRRDSIWATGFEP